MKTTVLATDSPKSMHPNRSDYAVTPVVCDLAPLLYPNIEGDARRAGHCYRRVDGIWTCRNCQAVRP